MSRGIKGLYLKADKFDEGGQDLVTEIVEMKERGEVRLVKEGELIVFVCCCDVLFTPEILKFHPPRIQNNIESLGNGKEAATVL